MLAQMLANKGENHFEKAQEVAQKGVEIMYLWGTNWDKRISWEGWISWGRCISYQMGKREWKGVENMGGVADEHIKM